MSSGPPKFKKLTRTKVQHDSTINPTEASVTEDFTKAVPLMFEGRPPAEQKEVAPLGEQEAALADIVVRNEQLTGPKPAPVAQPTVAKPPGVRRKIVTEGKAVPSMFVPEKLVPAMKQAEEEEEEGEPTRAEGEAAYADAAATVLGQKVPELPAPKAIKALGEVKTAEEAAELEPGFDDLRDHVIAAIRSEPEPSIVKPPVFVPENRRAFKPFVIQTFKKYILPPQSNDPDPETCTRAAAASSKELKTFQYQAFVRDYLQRASPYRGLLVYHGLGSGKTCTSIATAEALYGAGNRRIFIMTPASLRGNYRGELTKCGFFAFQQENYWTFVSTSVKGPSVELTFLTDTLGVPIDWIKKNKGAWVPDPSLPSNWKLLQPADQKVINEQIQRQIDSRFTFINYNGLTERRVREWACKTPRMFDGSVIIIDEVHNLIRTINNSNLENFYKQEPLEPEYKAKFCLTGKRYKISYLVYRLLCNAVGAKIVALSGTPIINYPQELGIMTNLLSGDMRYAGGTLNPAADKSLVTAFLNKHPEVDNFEIVSGDGTITVRLTPVPSGYRKVVNPTTGEMRGFVRFEDDAAEAGEITRERDLVSWMNRVETEMRTSLKLQGQIINNLTFGVNQRLPDIEEPFVNTFINTESLSLKEKNDLVLIARLSGLISYYKAGKPELVARVTSDKVIEINMSDRQLQQYTIMRNEEIKQEIKEKKGKVKATGQAKDGRYKEVVKNQKGTFKIFSRAACNFVFPDDIPRPRPGDVNLAVLELGAAASGDSKGGDVIAEGEQEIDDDASIDGKMIEKAKGAPEADPYQQAIRASLSALRAKGSAVFGPDTLSIYSPKFQAVLNNMDAAKGPVLVYSQFKTLEGLGIFGLSLEFQKNYIRFDIQPQVGGNWALGPELLLPENANKKRYITYTGDEPAEKRDLLKHIFNANWAKLPKDLAVAVKNLAGAENNINGKIAQAFMITQSGAEGISLENVRQVHLMEPYWNYVRLEQVRGRAIRICSHKSLPFDERTVDVFTYISKFSPEQIRERRVDETLQKNDGGLTTDQKILALANDKKRLADSLFDAMKRAAVDCELNASENGVMACYRLPPSMMPIYHPDLERDISESASSIRRK